VTDLDHPFRRKPPGAPEHCGEILPADQLHRTEDATIRLANVEHATDGGMSDLSRHSHFLENAFAIFRGRGFEDPERDPRPQNEVVGRPDLASAPLTKARDHPVATREHIAGYKRAARRT
jgi:hypothetical protein